MVKTLGVLLRPTKSEAIGGVEWTVEPHGYLSGLSLRYYLGTWIWGNPCFGGSFGCPGWLGSRLGRVVVAGLAGRSVNHSADQLFFGVWSSD